MKDETQSWKTFERARVICAQGSVGAHLGKMGTVLVVGPENLTVELDGGESVVLDKRRFERVESCNERKPISFDTYWEKRRQLCRTWDQKDEALRHLHTWLCALSNGLELEAQAHAYQDRERELLAMLKCVVDGVEDGTHSYSVTKQARKLMARAASTGTEKA